MKCISCGANLNYVDGMYVCESCGTFQQIETFFENIEVFICSVEFDSQGKRTKDSVIAQEVYKKLQGAKINVFYQRESAAGLIGEELDKVKRLAWDKVKIIIVCGASAENFATLLYENRDIFTGKNVIPIYTLINAHDLPKDLGKLQAVNYDNIGALNDVTKTILQFLGRYDEVDIRKIADEKAKKSKRIIIPLGIFLLVSVIVISYILFGTHLILKSKKYDYALSLIENNNFVEAIEILSPIDDYKDSRNVLKKIYDQYDGYYTNKDNTIILHIQTTDCDRGKIEITKMVGNKSVNAEVATMIQKNMMTFHFVDSQNNFGNGKIELENNKIKLQTYVESMESELCIGSLKEYFELSNKSDAPIFRSITKEKLLEWISVKTTEKNIYENGYKLNLEQNVVEGGYEIYNIENTDIKLEMFGFDVQKYAYVEELAQDAWLPEKSVFAAVAPAQILLPDKIGQEATPILENDYIYVPYSYFSGRGGVEFEHRNAENKKTIETTTPVFVTSKSVVSMENWNSLLLSSVRLSAYNAAKCKYYERIDDPDWSLIEAENETHYLVSIFLKDFHQNSGRAALYKVEKKTFTAEFVAEVDYEMIHTINSRLPETYWQTQPGLTNEFSD